MSDAVCAGGDAGLAASAFTVGCESRTRIGVPWDTLSPTLTLSSLTTPASGEGISIVALSDSSVMSDCSFATESPGLTRTSITSTCLKSPMSGTFTSMPAISEDQLPDVRQDRGEIAGKARRRGAVDHAVVVRQRERQHEARRELLAVPRWPDRRARDTEDRHFRRVDDRREGAAADAAEAGNGERAALHVAGPEPLVARQLRDIGELVRELEHT